MWAVQRECCGGVPAKEPDRDIPDRWSNIHLAVKAYIHKVHANLFKGILDDARTTLTSPRRS